MKRDQLDTQRQAENDGDRIRALVDKVQGWRNEANAEGARLNLLGDPEHGYFSEVEAYDKVLSELRATAATPTEPPKDDDEDTGTIKPCPFCGGTATMQEDDDGGNFIECEKCRATTNLQYSLKDDGRPQLIERWNQRVAAAKRDLSGRG